MADDSDSDKVGTESANLSNLLRRGDGGLLAVNLATLAIVTGAEKLDIFSDVVNIPILIGGLAIGVLFAVISLYFLVFGNRATRSVVGGSIQDGVMFDPELVFFRRGLLHALLVLFTPLIMIVGGTLLFVAPEVQNARDTVTEAHDQYRDCVWAAGAPVHYSRYWLIQDERQAKNAGKTRKSVTDSCSQPESFLKFAKKDLNDKNKFRSTVVNGFITIFVLFVISVPFLLWFLSRQQFILHSGWRGDEEDLRRGPLSISIFRSMAWLLLPRHIGDPRNIGDPDPEKNILERQKCAVQIYRTAAALISLIGFILGVGLALVNVTAANVEAGLTEAGGVSTNGNSGGGRSEGGGDGKTDSSGTGGSEDQDEEDCKKCCCKADNATECPDDAGEECPSDPKTEEDSGDKTGKLDVNLHWQDDLVHRFPRPDSQQRSPSPVHVYVHMPKGESTTNVVMPTSLDVKLEQAKAPVEKPGVDWRSLQWTCTPMSKGKSECSYFPKPSGSNSGE